MEIECTEPVPLFHKKFSFGCIINQYFPPQQLLLLDEGDIRVGALIEGDVLDVVYSRRPLQSRETQPVNKLE